jgi:hypothetical protein
MRAAELTQTLAQSFGVVDEVARRLDRALADAGMRRIAKGRAVVDMDRREALTFMIGCMVTEKITKTAEEVGLWINARAAVNPDPSDEIDPDWGPTEAQKPLFNHFTKLEAHLSRFRDDKGEVSLLDYLDALCAALEQGTFRPDRVKLMIDLGAFTATIEFAPPKKGGVGFSDQFLVRPEDKVRFLAPHDSEAAIHRGVWVHGKAFLDIIRRT